MYNLERLLGIMVDLVWSHRENKRISNFRETFQIEQWRYYKLQFIRSQSFQILRLNVICCK